MARSERGGKKEEDDEERKRWKDRRMIHRASENTGCTLHVYVCMYVCKCVDVYT